MDRDRVSNRQSNLELFRIVAMCLIIAHHYVVNSGVGACYSMASHPSRTFFMQCWGMFGKPGIDMFVFITGWFMCKSSLTVKRWLKVFCPVILYSAVTMITAISMGLSEFSWGGVANLFLELFRGAGMNGFFSASFPFFYLLIPVLNQVISRLGRREHGIVVASGIVLITGLGTVFGNDYVFNEIVWFCMVFFLAAWIRIYGGSWSRNTEFCVKALIATVVVCFVWIGVTDFIPDKGLKWTYHLVRTPGRLGSLAIGLFSFLVFRNIEIPHNAIINRIASSTYAVFLAHATWLGRKLLWQAGGVLDVSAAFQSLPLPLLIGHAFFAVLVVFAGGFVIDMVEKLVIARPFYRIIDKHEDTIDGSINSLRVSMEQFVERL